MTTLPDLSLVEARVLGVLVEKQHTVPDTYPLTLLALTAGCNQKSSRDPVLNATESEVQAAIDRLKTLTLVVESSGGRVMRYAQNVGRVLTIPAQAVALLAVLMLRGPQTIGELRINCDRLHRFADTSAVEAFLHELAARASAPLVALLARQPGEREARWAHLLSGVPQATSSTERAAGEGEKSDEFTPPSIVALEVRIADLADEVEALKATVAKLAAALGESAR
jgi:uncharacterized protein YceH (UPF0502 family)